MNGVTAAVEIFEKSGAAHVRSYGNGPIPLTETVVAFVIVTGSPGATPPKLTAAFEMFNQMAATGMVTLAGALCAETLPAASYATIRYVYVCTAVSPVSMKVGLVTVVMSAPSRYTPSLATPAIASVDGVHEVSTLDVDIALAWTPVGTVGSPVSIRSVSTCAVSVLVATSTDQYVTVCVPSPETLNGTV